MSDAEAGASAGARLALGFLADASASLARTLDPETTLANVVALAVPRIADWCAIDLADGEGGYRTFVSEHPDPDKQRLLDELEARYPRERGRPGADPPFPRYAEPSVHPHVDPAALAALARDAEHERLLRELDPEAYMVVPLEAGGRRLGGMVFLSTTAGRSYGPEDLVLAQDLARRCAQAVDNARLYGEARRAERDSDRSLALLDTLFDTAPVGLGFWDTELRYVRVNERLAEINGLPAADHLGRTVVELLPDLDPGVTEAFRRVLARGEPLEDVPASGITPAAPGVVRRWLGSYYPVRDSAGEVLGLGGVVVETTERDRAAAEHARLLEAEREARAQAEAARGRTEFLDRASVLLDESLDFERTLASLGWLVVPALADWFAVFLIEDDRLKQVTSAHVDPARAALADELGRRHPGRLSDPAGPGHVVATGRPQLLSEVTPDQYGQVAQDARHAELLATLGPRSAMTVPLVARGRTLGAMLFVSATPGRFEAPELDLARDLGRRAALRIDNATLLLEARAASARERHHADQLLGLTAAALAVSSARTRAEAAQVAVHRARALVEAGGASLSLHTGIDGRVEADWAPEGAERAGTDTGPLTARVRRERRAVRLDAEGVARELGWPAGAPDGYLGVPLSMGPGESAGVLEVVDPAGGAFGPEDEAVIASLASTLVVTLANLRLYEQRTHVARTLQASLLPGSLPVLPGLEVASRYRAAGEAEVGGDFYDLFEVGDRWWLVIGDVRGKGPEAAAVTALARYTLRAATMTDADPRRVLELLNEAMLAQRPGEFCTVALATAPVDQSGPTELSLTCAGHPQPLVLRADGQVEPAGRPGTLVGVVPDPSLHPTDVVLEPGDALLFFTDGVTEARVRSWSLGEEGLAALLAGCVGLDAAAIVQRIERTVVDVQAGDPRDDIALVAVRAVAAAPRPVEVAPTPVGARA